MIKLYGFGPQFGVADPSPFVLKIDAYLRMTGIEFETSPDFENLRKAPKGKLPFIEDGSETVCDSFFIIEYLRNKYHPSLDEWLSDEQRGIANLVIKSLDENFYWCIVYDRWISEDNWAVVKKAFFGGMPFPLKHIVPFIIRRNVKKALYTQGLGRHNEAEIKAISEHTLESLSMLLGGKPYFFGEQPCTLDAVAYGFLAQLTLTDFESPMDELAKKFENLVRFCERVQERYYQ